MAHKSFVPIYSHAPRTDNYRDEHDRIFGNKPVSKTKKISKSEPKVVKPKALQPPKQVAKSKKVKAPKSEEQTRVNDSLKTEQAVPNAAKVRKVKEAIAFDKMTDDQKMKTLFQTFPADELGGTTGTDNGVADAQLPKFESDLPK